MSDTALQIEGFLSPQQLKQFRASLAGAEWIDGAATAGHLSLRAKHNRQLPETSVVARQLGDVILDIAERHPAFMSFALPARVVPPLFNAYGTGEEYGAHVDGAIRPIAGRPMRVRTDVSATLFLSEPHEYDGGELVIEGTQSESYKLSAGTLLLYSSSNVHRVMPVTRGERLASFFWIQSMVRSAEQRAMLFNLDQIIQQLRDSGTAEPCLVGLANHYHNLLRQWADVS